MWPSLVRTVFDLSQTTGEPLPLPPIHGALTGGYSFGYVANWAREMAVFRRNIAAIQQTAQRLIVAIEGEGV